MRAPIGGTLGTHARLKRYWRVEWDGGRVPQNSRDNNQPGSHGVCMRIQGEVPVAYYKERARFPFAWAARISRGGVTRGAARVELWLCGSGAPFHPVLTVLTAAPLKYRERRTVTSAC